jgi:hypothetical protein
LTNWGELLRVGATLYGPINQEQDARDKLRRIRQRQSVTEYHGEFLQWALLCGYNEEALTDAFYQGLKEPIKDMMVNIARPTTIAGMLETALTFEGRILNRARERRDEPAKMRFGKAAEIKAMKLSPDERTKRMKEGRCFICNQTGHMARACPKKGEGREVKKATVEEAEGEEDFQEG